MCTIRNEGLSMNEKNGILIIDDDNVDRELVCRILRDNYEVYSATDGREGLKVLRRFLNRISVILLDIQMPVMNGFEFMKMVKSDESLKAIPIIVLSADDKGEQECLEKGALDYIRKPFNRKQIEARVHNTISLVNAVKKLSMLEVDSLTECGNRRVFFDRVHTIEKDEELSSKSIGIAFIDINGLKRVNDLHGHTAGDEHIKNIANKIAQVFTKDCIFRIGGDEFAVLSLGDDETSFSEKIEKLDALWTNAVSAAVGAVWLSRAVNLEESINRADRLMYEKKNRFYRRQVNNRRKARDGQNEDAIVSAIRLAEYVPAGFFGYYADGEEEIIFANEEVWRLYECDSEEEFLEHVGNSFKGMVHPDDLEYVENGIVSQIHKDKDSDFVEYRIICKNGEVKYIHDYGRFVHTEAYGNVFLVMIMDITPKRNVE